MTRAVMLLRNFLFLIVFAALLLLAVPVIFFCAPLGLKDTLIRYGRWVLLVCRRVLGIRLEVSGLENTRVPGPVVFMANHLSMLDGPLVVSALPRITRAIMKRAAFKVPVAGPAMRYAGFVPVDRGKARGGFRSIESAAELMERYGYSYVIFPEGTRSRDGHMQRLRRGGFFLAMSGKAPIVPISIKGTFELMPRGSRLIRPGTVRVEFHEPVPVEGYTNETSAELMEKVRISIAGGLAGRA